MQWHSNQPDGEQENCILLSSRRSHLYKEEEEEWEEEEGVIEVEQTRSGRWSIVGNKEAGQACLDADGVTVQPRLEDKVHGETSFTRGGPSRISTSRHICDKTLKKNGGLRSEDGICEHFNPPPWHHIRTFKLRSYNVLNESITVINFK